jgi:hypothetical protein
MTQSRRVRNGLFGLALFAPVALLGCSGSDSGGSTDSAVPASLAAEQLSLQLASSVDQDNTTAFSEQLTTQWQELLPTADAEGLTSASDIDANGGVVTISGGGVTCTVTVNNEPPTVLRACDNS